MIMRKRRNGHRTLLCTLLALAVVACSESDPLDPEPEPEPEPDPQAAEPVQLVEGTTLGAESFPPGNTASGGQGQPIAGLSCLDDDNIAHYHAHVSLFVEGERIAIPPAIGIVDPVIEDGFVQSGSCLYWMHTHDATGLIHIEPATPGEYTLGQLFDLWGRTLTTGEVAGYTGELSVFVDGVRYEGDPRAIVLTSRKHVSLQVGRPLAPPPMYLFQG